MAERTTTRPTQLQWIWNEMFRDISVVHYTHTTLSKKPVYVYKETLFRADAFQQARGVVHDSFASGVFVTGFHGSESWLDGLWQFIVPRARIPGAILPHFRATYRLLGIHRVNIGLFRVIGYRVV